MTAKQAREQTDLALSREGEPISGLLSYAYRAIDSASKAGKNNVVDPISGLRTSISHTQKLATYEFLRSEGFDVKLETSGPNETSYIVSW